MALTRVVTDNLIKKLPKFAYIYFKYDNTTMLTKSEKICFLTDDRGTFKYKGKSYEVIVLKMSGKRYYIFL